MIDRKKELFMLNNILLYNRDDYITCSRYIRDISFDNYVFILLFTIDDIYKIRFDSTVVNYMFNYVKDRYDYMYKD